MAEPLPFAPKPWGWQTSGKPGGNGDLNVYVIDRDDRKIAAVWGRRGEKGWTASLISLAPDFYAFAEQRAAEGDPVAQRLIRSVAGSAAHANSEAAA
jgi:hypothetical protein